ncbi:MAG: hypothetical protein JWN86_4301 [Planctomycetota bacterium]|nr:hypothetical protein [Planctomycetota bacterium]
MNEIDPRVRDRHRAAFFLISLLVGGTIAVVYSLSLKPLLVHRGFLPAHDDFGLPIVLGSTVIIANGIYRLLGLSLARKTVEGRAKVNDSEVELSGVPESVEIETPWPVTIPFVVFPLTLTVISLVMCCGGPNALASFGGMIGIPLFGVLTVAGFRRSAEPRVRANAQGILGTHYPTLGRRFVPWDEVASCEITRVRDAFGNDDRTGVVFKDKSGNKRLIIFLKAAPEAQIDGLLKYLRAVLPKAKFDPFDEL